jgi:hypothetical protein
LYEPKNGDTYEGICRDFYNDTRYAAALKEYNRGKALTGGGHVAVPPIHVLRTRYPQLTGVTTTSRTGAPGQWVAAGSTAPTSPAATTPAPVFRAGGSRTFTIPTGGMTMSAAARLTLGDPNRWKDLYNLNPQHSPGETLPAGTELKLPADAVPPN